MLQQFICHVEIKLCSRQQCTYFTFRRFLCNTQNQTRNAKFSLP